MQDELRLRAQMITAGVCLSAVLLVLVGVWVAFTWDRPHRAGLVVIVVIAAVATGVVAVIPRERIVAGRWREPFFLGWSLGLITFISVAADLDGGVRSPIVLMLFLTLVYAALSYPRWAVSVVSGVSLLAVLALSEIAGTGGGAPTDPVYLAGLMLTLALTGVMCIWQARIQQLARSELGRLSRSDPLTGCLNRLGFSERLAGELSRCERQGGDVALVLLDLDDFKAVNDRHGYPAGDELLSWAVHTMSAILRPSDALCRLGGDEFAVLLGDSPGGQVREVADRLVRSLAERVSASAGVASSDADGCDAEALHRVADVRLYAAKRARRGQLVVLSG